MIEPGMDDQQELIEIEQEWVRAHGEMDLQTIRSILDEDYTQLRTDGTLIGKSALVADYSTGQRHWDIAESEPIKVQIIGDIGLLFGKWRGKGMNHCQTFDYSTYFLAIYRKQEGKWKLLADASLVSGE
jgi:ketosteroid isomerase-like protein